MGSGVAVPGGEGRLRFRTVRATGSSDWWWEWVPEGRCHFPCAGRWPGELG